MNKKNVYLLLILNDMKNERIIIIRLLIVSLNEKNNKFINGPK